MTIQVWAGDDISLKVGQRMRRTMVVSAPDGYHLQYVWEQVFGPKQGLTRIRRKRCRITARKKGFCIFRAAARKKRSTKLSNAGWDHFTLTVK